MHIKWYDKLWVYQSWYYIYIFEVCVSDEGLDLFDIFRDGLDIKII